MDPQRKGALMQFTTAAKSIIFDAKRMQQFLPMMDTKTGAIQAVQAVISVIEQKKPVPPDIEPLLAVNVYLLMVDMAKDITRMQPDPEIVKGVVGEILAGMRQGQQQPAQDPAQAPAQDVQQGTMQPESSGLMGQKAMV